MHCIAFASILLDLFLATCQLGGVSRRCFTYTHHFVNPSRPILTLRVGVESYNILQKENLSCQDQVNTTLFFLSSLGPWSILGVFF